jgi:TatD DNase family protein
MITRIREKQKRNIQTLKINRQTYNHRGKNPGSGLKVIFRYIRVVINIPRHTFIDLHCHGKWASTKHATAVYSVRYQDAQGISAGKGMYSIGLHPWDAGSIHFDADLFYSLAGQPSFIAIGEVGLDKVKGPALDIQAQLFIKQVEAAEHYGKPIIIHCVKAWEELMALKKLLSPRTAWIIHGFRGKPELASQLVNNGFYLSFGEAILTGGTSLGKSVRDTPINRIFLETDESQVPISEVYSAAAAIRNCSLIELQIYITENFERAFGFQPTS